MSRTIAENDPVEWSSVAVSSCSKPIRKIVNGCHYFVVTGYSAKKGARKCWSSDLFNVGGYKWVIRFYQNGLEENSIYTSVSLGLASNGTDVEALFECALVDQSGKGRHCIRTDFNVPGKADPKGNIIMCKGMACFYDFIIRSTLENPKYLKNDCLLLHCKVGVVKKNCVPLSDMGLAFKSMFECQVGCDIAFHVKDETFKAHKVVLAARSPVFMALFYPPDGDLNLDKVVIEDVLPSIFKAMITFMYSDELPDVHRIASSSSCSSDIIIRHLMMAAEQYGMERLKLLCEAKLGKEIAADTVSSSQNLPSTKHGLKCGRKLKCIRGRPSTATGGAALLPEAQVYMSEICCNQFNRLDLAVKGTRSTEK